MSIDDKFNYSKEIPIEEETDILVIGGSQSGVAAAICAKRAQPSLNVTLIEQNGYLGGQSVGTMVIHYEFREYTNNAGQNIVKGIGKEIIRRIVEKGHSDPLYKEWLEGRGPPFKDIKDPRAMGDVPLDLEDIKLVLQEMCDESGVKIRFFTKLVDVIVNQNETSAQDKTDGTKTIKQTIKRTIKPEAAIITDMSGLKIIKSKIMIDCSANNDVAWLLGGNKYIDIAEQKIMAMQTYSWFGGVDVEEFIEEFWQNSDDWQLKYPNNKEQMLQHMREGKTIMMRGGAKYINEADEQFPDLMEQYENLGTTPLIYYWLKTIKTFPIEFDGKTKYLGWWAIEGPSFRSDQTNPENISKAMKNQLYATHILLKVHQFLPGWKDVFIVKTSDRMGFRQTRVLKGVYKLTRDDVKEHHKFNDVIGRNSGHDIGRGNPESEFGYDIPFRALVPEEIDGLLVGARSISCDISDETLTALNAHRGICSTIVVSQACGVAAALCLKYNTEPRNLDINILQEELRKQDVILEAPQ